ncbi:ATP-binding protein [Rhodopirellula baltica]|uniref:Uncharacterized protein n=1 Tax=Rhodopirellula baltica WH47 TaxID=991778 RepID=F2AY68_RHOBT|nr:hypothetical protein [Rhodopirellula baltica]EGF25385.1 hypothetical protein RBWH47_00855 [Rhodopirellula baltica WH47]
MLIRVGLLRSASGLAIALTLLFSSSAPAQQEAEDAAREALNAAGITNRFENVPRAQTPDSAAFLDVAPPLSYRVAQQAFFQGDVTRAIAILNRLQQQITPRDFTRHQLGQIPIRTLLGECHLQAGDLATAAEHYEAALQVVVDRPTFLSGIQWRVLTAPTSESDPERDSVRHRDPRGTRRRPWEELPNVLTRTELDLWPSARNVPLVLLRRYLLAGVPSGTWTIDAELPEEIDQLRGLDIAETLRQLSVAAYRLRWLRGREALLQDANAPRVLAATVPPGVLGTDRRFHAAGTLVTSARTALRYYAGDDSDIQLSEPLDQISGGFHVLTPIARLTRMRSLGNRWWLNRQIADGQLPLPAGQAAVVLPSPQDMEEYVATAVSTSEIAFALFQFQLAIESYELALEEIDRWDETSRLAGQLENELTARSEFLRTEAPSIAFQLRILAARAALLAGRPAAAQSHLALAERYRRSRRLNLPRSTAMARWLQLQAGVHGLVDSAQLDPQKANEINLQTLDELKRQRHVWDETLNQSRMFARGIQENAQPNLERSITHPMGYRFSRLRDGRRNQIPIATRSQRYQTHWNESQAGRDLTSFDHFCFTLDRDTWTGLGIELAAAADDDERVAARMDEHQSSLARSSFGEYPAITDLRTALRQVSLNDELSLNDFFQNHDELVEALQPLIPSMSLNPKVLGLEAAILHERLQAQLAALALEQIMLPQVEPPPIPLRNGRPNWRELPDGVAIVSFHMTDDELVGSLVHRGQASHWQVEDANELCQQSGRWVAQILSSPTLVDAIGKEAVRRRMQQLELDMTKRLFPPLCGIDHPEIKNMVVVPSGFLWQFPFEELVVQIEENNQTLRWKDRYSVVYAHTVGTAMQIGTSSRRPFAPEEFDPVVKWTPDKPDDFPSLNQAPPEQLFPGPRATWGDAVWWGNTGGNVLAAHDTVTPLSSFSAGPFTRGDEPWDRRLVQIGNEKLRSWVDLSSRFPELRKVSTVFQTEIQNHLFVQASRGHAAGLDDLVMARLPILPESSELLMEELSIELGHVPFAEAWNRSTEILRVSDFTFPEGVNLVPLNEDAGGLSGNHPLVQTPYIHLPFSGL